MKMAAVVLVLGMAQFALGSNDADTKSSPSAKKALRSHNSHLEHRTIVKERRSASRDAHKAQVEEERAEIRRQSAVAVRQELQQSIQEAKTQAREQVRKLVEEERILIRTGP